jgi:hypothetical protein
VVHAARGGGGGGAASLGSGLMGAMAVERGVEVRAPVCRGEGDSDDISGCRKLGGATRDRWWIGGEATQRWCHLGRGWSGAGHRKRGGRKRRGGQRWFRGSRRSVAGAGEQEEDHTRTLGWSFFNRGICSTDPILPGNIQFDPLFETLLI